MIRSAVLLLLTTAMIHGGCGGCSDDGSGIDGDGGFDVDGGSELDAGPCQTVLCGSPAVCCEAGTECIEGACLDICESGIRCGVDSQTCCSAGQVCLADECATPGVSCVDSYDCVQPGEFCEPTLGQCLPQPANLDCEYVPTFAELDVIVEWKYETDQIISIPVVADVDGDQLPDVVVNLTQMDSLSWPGGLIAILDGQTGVETLRIPHSVVDDQYGSYGRSSIAAGDVNGDGVADIVYASRALSGGQSLIVAVDGSGTLLWTSHAPGGSDYHITVENAAITLANFDDDPEAEVVVGATLIDNDGLVVWDEGGSGGGGAYGTNSGYTGGISAVADLNGDDIPEIISGKHAWNVDWQMGPAVTVTNYWTYSGNDGYPAIADLDGDGTPEVVLVASRQVVALNGQSGELWCGIDPTDALCLATPSLRTAPLDIPGGASNNRGGPPTISDFDADGRAEVGVAGGYSYSVYDFNRSGEDVVQPLGDPSPDPGAIYVRWSQITQDLSSNATGSSVFDFQGDGAAEVVYADECYMRVYSGTDGTVQLELENSSATIHEYPLVVDVDADGNSEILIVANEKSCGEVPSRQGLFVYGDMNDEWVPTRRVWPQHTYHVTNSTSIGNVPVLEDDNWTTVGLNNYRQNVQGDGVFNAPDLAADLSIQCGASTIVLQARVTNLGALGVPPGAVATFYEGQDATGTELGTATTTVPLLPGASTIVTVETTAPIADTDYFVAVDGSAAVTVVECDDTNNTALTTQAGCSVIE